MAQEIDLTKMPPQQLIKLKESLEAEINYYFRSLQQLKMAQQKFGQSAASLKSLTPENQGKEILVPLTSTMYIPGTLENTERVLVDIGTGYFVTKTSAKAQEYFQRRIDGLTETIERVQAMAKGRSRDINSVEEVLRMQADHMRRIMEAQEKQAAKAKA
eukprot:m.147617 g.147617  ORF g.147617 m.147617 type:complete len:159 (-) comp20574_c0_seq12:119-595(-)